MIIWLASYPKSGNTWVRVLISKIINFDKIDFENPFGFIDQIESYPNVKHFSTLIKDFNNPDEIVPNWINSQNLLNLNKNIKIFKTHNMLGSFGKHSFTDLNNTTGVIHIVRDPRNIVTSLKNHFSDETFEETIEMLFEKFNWSGLTENEVPQLLSSWQNHYNSWKKFPNNNLLIRYEDILNNPKNEINRIANYIKKFIKLEISDKKINKIIFNTTFNNFKKQEAKGYFKENSINKKTGEKNIFFYLGPNNNWKSILNKKFSDEIEEKFKIEMQELGYI